MIWHDSSADYVDGIDSTPWYRCNDTPTTKFHEPLLDHNPTPESVAWSVVSVIILLCGIGIVVWMWAFGRKQDEHELTPPAEDPISKLHLTPSQRSLGKYLFTILALFLLQLGMGGIIAHYTVEGQAFLWHSIGAVFPIFYCSYLAYSSILVLDCDGILECRFILGADY
ncbi:MAG: hypothetical protein ACLUPK_09305 [Veillonella sp.]